MLKCPLCNGSSKSILDLDLSTLFKKNNVDELNHQLQLHVKKLVVDSGDTPHKGRRSPFFSTMYFIIKQNGAKDWWTELSLSKKHVGKSHSIQYPHIFPKSLLKRENFDKKEINEIFNLAFIGGKR